MVATEDLKIDSEEDVVVVRRRVRTLAEEQHFDPFATAAITTATSELARNVWLHAKKGIACVELVEDGTRLGIRVEFRDEGPGIVDPERALEGTRRSRGSSLGLGLSGSRRLVDDFEIDSVAGRGTVIRIIKWRRAT